MIIIINLILMFYNIYCLNLPIKPEQNRVILHLEKFNNRLNLLHIGISFDNNINKLRYDFRPCNYGKTYLTTNIDRTNIYYMFPDAFFDNTIINILEDYTNDAMYMYDNKNNLDKKNILWGVTNYSQKEIIEYEKKELIYKKYKLGIYDCRHYVNKFTLWCMNKPTPIWNLHKLWDKY